MGTATHDDERSRQDRKRPDNQLPMVGPRPFGLRTLPTLLEQLDLGARPERGDGAKVGWRASFGKAEGLGPQALVAEEALDALALPDQARSFMRPPQWETGAAKQRGVGTGRLGPRVGCRRTSLRSSASTRPRASIGSAIWWGPAWLGAWCALAGRTVSATKDAMGRQHGGCSDTRATELRQLC